MNSFGFELVGLTKRAIWRGHFGLWGNCAHISDDGLNRNVRCKFLWKDSSLLSLIKYWRLELVSDPSWQPQACSIWRDEARQSTLSLSTTLYLVAFFVNITQIETQINPNQDSDLLHDTSTAYPSCVTHLLKQLDSAGASASNPFVTPCILPFTLSPRPSELNAPLWVWVAGSCTSFRSLLTHLVGSSSMLP